MNLSNAWGVHSKFFLVYTKNFGITEKQGELKQYLQDSPQGGIQTL